MNLDHPSNALPVSLLLADRPGLVVGGGKVALRKTGHLLDADVHVTVVAPELCEGLTELTAAGRVTHIARPFGEADVEGMALVFAATNDRFVNRQVLEACHRRKVLCCCVDGNWAKGDFTTPAIARHGGLTLAVSTAGQSCRQSKLVKDSLARHIEMVETATLAVIGTDHRHLSISEREPFHLTGKRLEQVGFMVMQLWGIHEFMILNTCNRVELMAVVSKETAANGILRHVMGFDALTEDRFYFKKGPQAFEHLCLVTAGMLSQTPGESHIAAQLKASLADAQDRGWAGRMMQEWVSVGLHISKHIQTDVAPQLRKEEIEELALNWLDAQPGGLAGKTVLVLGAGMVGRGLVQAALFKAGKIVWCYHINRPEIPADWTAKVDLCTFNSIKDRLGEADVIISAVEAPGYVLHSGHEPFFDQEKKVTLIDLGMPRNIDPALKNLSPEIMLTDLDGLKNRHRRSSAELEEVFVKCRAIIAEHREQYERIVHSFQSGNA